jgi:hypothetical protein
VRDALDVQAVRAVPFGEDAAHGVFLLGDLAELSTIPRRRFSSSLRRSRMAGVMPRWSAASRSRVLASKISCRRRQTASAAAMRAAALRSEEAQASSAAAARALSADVCHQVGELAVHVSLRLKWGAKVFENFCKFLRRNLGSVIHHHVVR